MPLVRLNKYIAESGECSRRKADRLIEDGLVLVNEKKAVVGQKIDSEKDKVKISGKQIETEKDLIYYALNKPRDVISAVSDSTDRKKVTDFVPEKPRVYPVGRLDFDSQGLIILTNDGELTQKLTHPSFEHQKEYFVRARASSSQYQGTLQMHKKIKYEFEKGIIIDGQLMKADSVANIKSGGEGMRDISFDIILHTGFNRQIRRMCENIHLDVVKLTRTRICKLRLKELGIALGEYREISRKDILNE